VVHSNTIADANGVDLEGSATSLVYSDFHRFSNSAQVQMPGDNLAKAIYNADERLI
jgi:hypothetical protein